MGGFKANELSNQVQVRNCDNEGIEMEVAVVETNAIEVCTYPRVDAGDLDEKP